jgi:hypothetical protein
VYGECTVTKLVIDLVLFSCTFAFVTGIVILAAYLLMLVIGVLKVNLCRGIRPPAARSAARAPQTATLPLHRATMRRFTPPSRSRHCR